MEDPTLYAWLPVTPSGGDGRDLGGVPRVCVHTPQPPPLGVEGASRLRGCPRLARPRGRTLPPEVRGNAREADPEGSDSKRKPTRRRTSSSPTGRTRTPARSPRDNTPTPSSSPRRGSSTASPANPPRVVTATNLGTLLRSDVTPPPPPPASDDDVLPRPSQLDPRRARVHPRVRCVRRRSTGRSSGRDDGRRGALLSSLSPDRDASLNEPVVALLVELERYEHLGGGTAAQRAGDLDAPATRDGRFNEEQSAYARAAAARARGREDSNPAMPRPSSRRTVRGRVTRGADGADARDGDVR